MALAAAATALVATGAASSAPGDLARVSAPDGGAQATAASSLAAVSADGRWVAFASDARLTAAATGALTHLYVRDRVTGRTVLASADAAGAPANAAIEAGDTFDPKFDVSGDGRYAVFTSKATNLVPADGNAAVADVFRKDLRTGAVAVVSVGADGAQPTLDGVTNPSVSYDGDRVAFQTGAAKGLVPQDTDANGDVVLRDMAAGTTVLVSQNSAGQKADGFCERPAISADGRRVAFEAVIGTTNLYPGQDTTANNVAVRDLLAGTTVPVAVATDGATAGGSGKPDISGDGRYVVFETGARLDPVADTNAANDVYRRDLTAGATVLASARDGLATGSAGGANPAISADGSRVAFTSASTDLTAADANAAQPDVYVRDPAARATRRASEGPGGAQGAKGSDAAAIAGNGGLVAFTYDDVGNAPLLPGDTNLVSDVFATEFAAGDATAPALTAAVAAPGPGGTAGVTGVAGPDPSGITRVTVAGAPVATGPGGAFSATVPAAAAAAGVAVTAEDGSGNTTTRTVTPAAAGPGPGAGGGGGTAGPARPVRVLRASLVRRTVVVRLRLAAPATVRAQALRVVRTRPRVRLVRTGRPVTRRLAAGTRVLRVPLPARAPAGAYRVRVTSGAVSVTLPAGRLRAR